MAVLPNGVLMYKKVQIGEEGENSERVRRSLAEVLYRGGAWASIGSERIADPARVSTCIWTRDRNTARAAARATHGATRYI